MIFLTSLILTFLLSPVQGSPLGRGNAIDGSHICRDSLCGNIISHVTERKLDNIEDQWSGTGDKDEYVMEQITAKKGDKVDKKELDWTVLSTHAVSDHGRWGNVPLRRYVTGLAGCTAITIVSDKGYWYAHFLEPGFDTTAPGYKQSWWDNHIIGALRDGTNKLTRPGSLVGPGGILNQTNNVKIYVSTPRTKRSTAANPVLLYPSKVKELMAQLTGLGRDFYGVPVTIRSYHPQRTEREQRNSAKTALGKVLIEYDNNQPNYEQSKPKKIYRVWLEQDYYEHEW